jgi:hypothetical protein
MVQLLTEVTNPNGRTEDDIGPYKRHELLTGKIYYPALGYSGYGDGKRTHIADFVNHEMRLDWLANRDRLLAFWKSGQPISKFFPDSKPWLLDRGDPDSLPWAEQVFGDGGTAA